MDALPPSGIEQWFLDCIYRSFVTIATEPAQLLPNIIENGGKSDHAGRTQ